MAKPLLGDLGMHAPRQQMSCMAVPQIVEAHSRQLGAGIEASEFVSEAIRLERLTVGLGYHEHIIRLRQAKLQQFLGLARLVPAQLLDGKRSQRHRPGTPALRTLLPNADFCLFRARDY
jgi:hypothetical protein